MEASERFMVSHWMDTPRCTNTMQQIQKGVAIPLEILKCLGDWHHCEVPTLFNLALSHAITYLQDQEKNPLEILGDPFEKCLSKVSVIRYLASRQLLIPLLKQLPSISISKLKLCEFLNPEECLHLLQKSGKNLYCLYFYRPSLPVSIKELAELAPHLENIEVNEPLAPEELRQLMTYYPKIKRIGPVALRGIDSDTLRELLQRCTELTELDYAPPEHIKIRTSFQGILSSSLRVLRISKSVEKSFDFASRCPNLTSLTIIAWGRDFCVNSPLSKMLQQCPKLTELSLHCYLGGKEKEEKEEPTSFDNILKITGDVSVIQEEFSVIFPNAEIWWKRQDGIEGEYIEGVFKPYQNIKSVACSLYKSLDREYFQQFLEIYGASLESIRISGEATDTIIDMISTHCKKLEKFVYFAHPLKPIGLIKLFEAIELKNVKIFKSKTCDDKVVKSLLQKSGKSLTHLKIIDCPITVKSLCILAQLGRAVKKLKLNYCEQISGANLAKLVRWTPNLKVIEFGSNLSNEEVALISQRLPNLRRVHFFVNNLFDIKKGWKCFSDDIEVQFSSKFDGDVYRGLKFQNEKANTRSGYQPSNGFLSFHESKDGVFRGYVENNKPHGKGKFIKVDGESYEGNYQDGMKHGSGIQTFPDGRAYEVEYINDELVKMLPSNTEATAWEEQFFNTEGEGKEPEKSEETSKGQKTKRPESTKTEFEDEDEDEEVSPRIKRSRIEEEKKPH